MPTSIPFRRDPPAPPDLLDQAYAPAALVLALVAAVVGAWLWLRLRRNTRPTQSGARRPMPFGLERLLASRPASDLASVKATRLTPRHSVHEVHWQGQRLLVGCSDQFICVLAQAPQQQAEPGEPARPVHPTTASADTAGS